MVMQKHENKNFKESGLFIDFPKYVDNILKLNDYECLKDEKNGKANSSYYIWKEN